MSTVPNGSTKTGRQARVRRNARPSTTSNTPRRERLTHEDGIKMFDLGVEIGQMRDYDPLAEYTRGYREGFDAGRQESEPATPLADAVEEWLTDPTSVNEDVDGDPADGPGLSVRCVISEVLALVDRDGADLSEAARGAATLAAACLLDALGVVPTDLC